MKNVLSKLKQGWLSVIICVAFASVGSMCFIPGLGIVSCLPLITLCTVFPALIVDKYFILPPLFFTLTYFFTFAVDTLLEYPSMPGGFALFVAVCSALISAVVCLGVFIIKSAITKKSKKALKISLAVIVIILSAVMVFPINGTPWSYVKASNEINAHIEENFNYDELNVGMLYHIPFSDSYTCDVYVDSTCTPSVSYTNGTISGTLTKDIIKYISNTKALDLTNTLRKSFPNDRFIVQATSISKKYGKISVRDSANIYPYIGYTVEVVSEETAKSFVNKVQEYVAVLDSCGIETNAITFVGGAKQKLYYRIEVDMGAPHTELDGLLKPYDTTLPYKGF